MLVLDLKKKKFFQVFFLLEKARVRPLFLASHLTPDFVFQA